MQVYTKTQKIWESDKKSITKEAANGTMQVMTF